MSAKCWNRIRWASDRNSFRVLSMQHQSSALVVPYHCSVVLESNEVEGNAMADWNLIWKQLNSINDKKTQEKSIPRTRDSQSHYRITTKPNIDIAGMSQRKLLSWVQIVYGGGGGRRVGRGGGRGGGAAAAAWKDRQRERKREREKKYDPSDSHQGSNGSNSEKCMKENVAGIYQYAEGANPFWNVWSCQRVFRSLAEMTWRLALRHTADWIFIFLLLLLLLLHLPRPSRPQNSPARSREPSFFPSFLSFCIFDLAWWWPLTLRRLFYLLILFSCAPLPHSSVFLCIRLLFGGSSNSQLNAPLTPPPLLSLSLTFFPSRATSPFDLFPQIRSTGPNWSQLLTSSFHL